MVVRWEGGMVLVVQVIVGVWAAWVGWGRGKLWWWLWHIDML